MIANPNWFQRRKYGGWGVSPKTWQGWVYLGIVIGLFVIFQSLPYWDVKTRSYVTIGWLAFLFIDIGQVMMNLKRDEREYKIEAIAERNAAWMMMFVLIIGILYEAIRSALNESFEINIFLIVALLSGALVKTISNIILERRNL